MSPRRSGKALSLREAARLASAVEFLTRIPVPEAGWEEGRLSRASRWFGLVGALVGAASAGVWLLAGLVLPAPVAAGLAIAAGLWLSGALHEDGLSDTADALGGHAPPARALEIMRDSRIGAYGALALILCLGLRWTALAALAPAAGALALLLGAAAGRGLLVGVAAAGGPARPDGLASGFRPRGGEAALALLPAAVLAVAAGAEGLLALALSAGLAALLAWRVARRIGGHTGDTLGASAAVAETAVLVVLAGGR